LTNWTTIPSLEEFGGQVLVEKKDRTGEFDRTESDLVPGSPHRW
jgi:hypothetical protein